MGLGLSLRAFSGLVDDPLGLVAVVGGKLPVRGQHFAGREDLFAVARGMCGDLGRFMPLETAPFNRLDYLLAAGAGGVEIFLGKLWSYATAGKVFSSPAVANGVVYIGSSAATGTGVGDVYALNASNGGLLWHLATTSLVEASPTVANGVVYNWRGRWQGICAERRHRRPALDH